jgi:hypothetical protein
MMKMYREHVLGEKVLLPSKCLLAAASVDCRTVLRDQSRYTTLASAIRRGGRAEQFVPYPPSRRLLSVMAELTPLGDVEDLSKDFELKFQYQKSSLPGSTTSADRNRTRLIDVSDSPSSYEGVSRDRNRQTLEHVQGNLNCPAA